MSRARVLVALALITLSITAACAEDKVVSNTSTATSIDVQREPGSPAVTDPAPGSGSGSVQGRTPGAGSYSAAQPPPAGFRDPDLAARGAIPLTARVSPGCVEHGQKLSITARTRAGAYVRISVIFPNGEFKDVPAHTGTAGSSGAVEWSLKVTDAAKTGEGRVQISARNPDTAEQGSTGTWDFVVTAPGGCTP